MWSVLKMERQHLAGLVPVYTGMEASAPFSFFVGRLRRMFNSYVIRVIFEGSIPK
jgi:hypothetical protein